MSKHGGSQHIRCLVCLLVLLYWGTLLITFVACALQYHIALDHYTAKNKNLCTFELTNAI